VLHSYVRGTSSVCTYTTDKDIAKGRLIGGLTLKLTGKQNIESKRQNRHNLMWTWPFSHYPSYVSVPTSNQSWDTKHSSHSPGPEYFQITQQRCILGILTLPSILASLYTTNFIIQQFLIFKLSVVTDLNQISK